MKSIFPSVCLLLLVAAQATAQQEPPLPVDLDGPVIAGQKYSFTIRTAEGEQKIAIPNQTPISMRLIRPSLDFETERVSMTLPISSPDGDAANNKTLEFDLPVPLYVQVDFKSDEQQQAIMAKKVKSLTFYRLSATPFAAPTRPNVINGRLIAGGKPGVYRLLTDNESLEVRLVGRKGLLDGFSILGLKPNESIAFARGNFADDGTFFATSIQFAPIADPTADDMAGLPRCLFLGDSLSFNYQRPLHEALAGKVNLYHPPENCGGSASANRIHHWLGNYTEPGRSWNVITFNFGLHDDQTDKTDYQDNLRGALKRLQQTGASLIWVTTTPIDYGFNGSGEDGIPVPAEDRAGLVNEPNNPVGQVPGRMRLQNQWAAEVLVEYPDVAVCDLWQLVKDGQEDFFADWWFNKNANFDYPEAVPLGRALAKQILNSLGKPESDINPETAHTVEVPEEYR